MTVFLMTIANLVSAWFILGGFSKVYPAPSNLPILAMLLWLIPIEMAIILGHCSVKRNSK